MTHEKNMNWEEIYEHTCSKIPRLESTKDFKEWFMSNEKNGHRFDHNLIARCFRAYKDMTSRDKDHFMLLVGQEGLGKSTLAVQLASWIDPNFCLENICWTPAQYIERIRTVPKGSCLVLDEGGMMLYSRQAMSAETITMNKLFMLQRQKNISVIVIIPSFWDLDRYVREHRVNTLIRIFKQGKYCGYLPKAINIINELSHRKKALTQIRCPNGSFWHGHFRKPFPNTIDHDAYKVRKADHLKDFMDSLDADLGKPKMIMATKVAKDLGLTTKQMLQRISKGSIPATKIGSRWFISSDIYEKLLGKTSFEPREEV